MTSRKQKTCILDIDDTVGNLRTPLSKLLNDYTGKDLHWKQWPSFSILDYYKISDQTFYDIIIESNVLSYMDVHDGVIETLTKLQQNDNKIVFISARNYHPLGYEITKQWLIDKGIPHDAVHISGHGIKKSLFAKMYDNIALAVDDNVENCIDFKTNARINNTLLFDMPWNQHSEMKRIYTIKEALETLT